MPELNLILLGPPGSGKGTQGERLQEDFRLPYYATGDILRAAVKEGTEIGKQAKEFMDRGDLVPDEVIIGVIAERLQQDEAADGFILDGFPRTVPQAEALDEKMKELRREMTAAILIDVSEDEVVRRLGGRRTCEQNPSHIYHVEFDPPKEEGVCDLDGAKLIVRDDDKPNVIKNRLSQYREKTAPLVDYYEERGILNRVNGAQSPDEVEERSTASSPRFAARKRRGGETDDVSRHDHPQDDRADRRDGGGRQDPGPLPADAALQGPPRRHHRGARRGRREVHPVTGRGPLVQGLPGLPGLDLRFAQLDGRPRHPRPHELRRGDILSIDVGVTYEGWVADAAITVPIGEKPTGAEHLLTATKDALFEGIAQAVKGNHLGHLACRPAAGGARRPLDHPDARRPWVGRDMHEDPQIPNFGDPGKGPELEIGMVLAIEPMVNAGGADIRMGSDGWAVYSADDSLAAHFEFTVAITEDGPRVLTPWHLD